MIQSPKIVVITGAESTGKSSLAKSLSDHYNAPCIMEYAREYVENLERPYNFSDVESIARYQVKKYLDLKESNASLIFIDTWLIITKIWFEEVFGKTPGWLNGEIRNNPVDLYLVCDTDIPWIKDPVRENGGEKRIYLQKRYLENIENFNGHYHVVSGKNDERIINAIQFVDQLL